MGGWQQYLAFCLEPHTTVQTQIAEHQFTSARDPRTTPRPKHSRLNKPWKRTHRCGFVSSARTQPYGTVIICTQKGLWKSQADIDAWQLRGCASIIVQLLYHLHHVYCVTCISEIRQNAFLHNTKCNYFASYRLHSSWVNTGIQKKMVNIISFISLKCITTLLPLQISPTRECFNCLLAFDKFKWAFKLNLKKKNTEDLVFKCFWILMN